MRTIRQIRNELAPGACPRNMVAMRITGGSARGINLSTGKARQVRPATDRMREAVFSSLGDRVRQARFLDLFAGAGCYGLEALSRGAVGGLFVEKLPAAVAAIEQNLNFVVRSMGGLPPGAVSTICRDVMRFSSQRRFTLVFMDPPYELARSHAPILLERARGFLEPGEAAVVVFELPADLQLECAGWHCIRRIGKSGINEPSVHLLQPDPQ